jgi:putative membrane protein
MSDDLDQDPPEGGRRRDPEHLAARRLRVEAAALHGAERGLLAWVRTGIALMTFGFVMGRIFLYGGHNAAPVPGIGGSQMQGTVGGLVLIVCGGLVCAAAAIRYVHTYRAILRGEQVRPSMHGPAAIAFGAAVMSVVALAVLGLAFLERTR